jgi:hypothetical protein
MVIDVLGLSAAQASLAPPNAMEIKAAIIGTTIVRNMTFS